MKRLNVDEYEVVVLSFILLTAFWIVAEIIKKALV